MDMTIRNWIEEYFGKRLAWSPVNVGKRGGRCEYAVDFEDGTEALCFIDFAQHEIEVI